MNGTTLFIPPLVIEVLILAMKAALLLVPALAVRAMLRRTSASTRYFLISVTIIIVAALPFLSVVAPDRELPLPAVVRSHLPDSLESTPLSANSISDRKAHTTGNITSVDQGSTLPTSNATANFLIYLWLLGTAVTAGRVLTGWAACARRRLKAAPLESISVRQLVDAATRKIGLRTRIAVLVSSAAEVPYVSGVFRPVLFLPRDVLRWPRGRLMSVILHELAHIKRGDHITWPLACLVVSWLWFNPLVWLALAQMKRDGEKACDDWVLSCGGSNVNYARHLLEVCLSLKASSGPAPVSLTFARKNNIKERIVHMLSQRVDRRPISRTRQLSLALTLVLIASPLISITGFSTTTVLTDISPAEREAIVATLDAFYAELSAGSDYQLIRDRFLTSDYFDDPNLTFENLDEAVYRPVFDNTLFLIQEEGVGVAKEVSTKILSMRREGDEVVVTQQVDVIADRIRNAERYESEDGEIIVLRDSSTAKDRAMEECRLVDSLSHEIRFKQEDGLWKISHYDDGIAVMQMDTHSSHGPIFLVWIENIDTQITPMGPGIFKVIPRDIVPDARNTRFRLEKQQ